MRAAGRPAWTSASDPQPEVAARLRDLRPLGLEPVTDTEGRRLWNAPVDRHHHLGYRRPFGAHVRYLLTDRDGRRLGCLLFEAVRRTLPCRDRNRHLMVVNPRYPVFPWVRSKFLASPALALAVRQLADDWERLHGWRPVMCGTFVDGTRFRASCHRGAGWRHIGETGGTGGRTVKGVHLMPLRGNARGILRGEDDGSPTRAERGRSAASDRRFGRHGCRGARGRPMAEAGVGSLPVMPFVFRLTVTPGGQGYRTTLCGLWEECAAAGVDLPQDGPPAASTACEARGKLDGAAFRRLHREVWCETAPPRASASVS